MSANKAVMNFPSTSSDCLAAGSSPPLDLLVIATYVVHSANPLDVKLSIIVFF